MGMGTLGFELFSYVIWLICFFIAFCGADWFFAVLEYLDDIFDSLGGYDLIYYIYFQYRRARYYGTVLNHAKILKMDHDNRYILFVQKKEDLITDELLKIEQQIDKVHDTIERADVYEAWFIHKFDKTVFWADYRFALGERLPFNLWYEIKKHIIKPIMRPTKILWNIFWEDVKFKAWFYWEFYIKP